MDTVNYLNFFLMAGVLIPGFVLMAAWPARPAGVKTGLRTERRR